MFRKIYLKLTLRLEAFTHTVPLPFAIYFSVVTGSGSYLSKSEMAIVAIAGSINATALIILGCIWRWFYLKKLFREIKSMYSNSSMSNEEKVKIKLKLLNYPLKEARIIVLRWFTGIIGSHLLIILVAGLRPGLHLTAPFLFFMITPISYIAYFFISENIIGMIFKLRKVKQIEIGINQIPQFNSFQRITFSMVAITAMPVIVLGYMLFGIKTGLVKMDDPTLHLMIMSVLFPVPVIIVGYVVAKTFRNGIMGINDHLNQLGKGNFSIISMPTSSDDFGLQAYNLNLIIKKLKSLYHEISYLNINLEKKVLIRTEELNTSLEKVEALKVQQDGDYFLTSLLLRPLGQNKAVSKNFEFSFFVKQKKQFEFKGKGYEIGGDICVTHTIQLMDKTFHIFLNGDAMGKSIQGAGGSLILGSVFQSIIERTLLSADLSTQSPEVWLRNTFIEMHKVFESFEGAMLVSLIIGLLDDANGFIYYMNAEHPPSILYRDGKAQYIEEESAFRKLGTLQINSGIFIQTYQLQRGDTLILGSDGRDDIRMLDENGIANINSNPKRILQLIEAESSDLPNIYNSLKNTGDVYDDLSLLKIHYCKPVNTSDTKSLDIDSIIDSVDKLNKAKKYDEAINFLKTKMDEFPEEYHILKHLSKLYANLFDYKDAIFFGSRYIEFNPGDNDFIYTLSTYYKFANDYTNSLKIGERLRLRNPQHINNLLNLIEINFITGQFQRAEELIQNCLKYEPDNPVALKIREDIKTKSQANG